MYTIEIFKEGIERLGISDGLTIAQIHFARTDNIIWLAQKEEKEQARIAWANRFRVPGGLKKKEYAALQKETQAEINRLKDLERQYPDDEFYKEEKARFMKKKVSIKIVMNGGKQESLDITKAKTFPIDQLLDFDYRGFRKCLWHEEKTPSFRYNKTRNKAHCFSCNLDVDAIDIYQKINNVDFATAVKKLS